MKTVSIISQKGGAGKTTLALHIAVAAELDNKQTAIIDLDPQASASSWGDSRDADTPVIVSAQSARLSKVLNVAKESGVDLSIIDTAPHSESSALAAARASDLILIPCRPAILDLKAISASIDLARLSGNPAFVVLNAIPPRGSLADDAATAISGYGVDVCPMRVSQRAAFTHSLTAGQTSQEYEPEGKAAYEIQKLYMFICQHVDMLVNEHV